MKKHLYAQLTAASIFLICSHGLFCQSKVNEFDSEIKEPVEIDDDIEIIKEPMGNENTFIIVEDMPQFGHGDYALLKYIMTNTTYPKSTIENCIEGRVFVRFVVNEDGWVSDVEVVRGVCYELDREAARVIENMPQWKPGKHRGKPVKVTFIAPINFRLNTIPDKEETVNIPMEEKVTLDLTEKKEEYQFEFSLYPNPTTDIINIQTGDTQKFFNYELFNQNGKLLSISKFNSENHQLNVSEFAKGTYLLRVISENGKTNTKRFIKN